MILFGVVIYTYFLYNDVIRLEREVVNLKSAVTRLEVGNTIKELVAEAESAGAPAAPLPTTIAPTPTHPFDLSPILEDDDNFDDDNDSVTSNEIKELLTNINEDIPATATTAPPEEPLPTPAPAPPAPSPEDLSELSEQELLTYKYEDLRAYLKAKGISCKNGPKIDLVRRILSKAAA